MPRDADRPPADHAAFPALRVVRGAAFELCAELGAFTSGPARASLESGKTWIRETRRLAGRELLADVARYSLTTYVHLATLAVEIGDDVDIDALLDRITSLDPERLQQRVIGADVPMVGSSIDVDDLGRAASGDRRALARLRSVLGDDRGVQREFDRIVLADATQLQRDLGELLAAWADRVFPRWGAEALAAIDRDAAAKTELLARTSPREVIEAATMGLTFEPAPWVREVVIAPTVALRPFVVPTDFDSTKLFLVSVSDEAIEPEGLVPGRLVKLTAALGDPIRMRALHELASHDGLTASALAERLGVERTTLHHHLGILRSAGLVAIEDRGDAMWQYRVRRERIDELGGLLRSYIGDEA